MNQPIRILHVLGSTDLGGAESRIMDLYRHIDKGKIQFDFLVHSIKEGFFESEIKQMGGNIYYLPSFRVYNYFKYKNACCEFFKMHREFEVVQGHMTSTASIYLPQAKKAGIPITVAHARSAGVDGGVKGFITKLLRKNLYRKCDYMFACSDLAARAVFGDKRYKEGKTIFIPNAVDTKEFAPDAEMRKRIRSEYELEDCFVIGHVGRFHYAKNHEFLLEVFAGVLDRRPDARLMLLGDGPRRAEMEAKARELGIDKEVVFAGNKNPVAPFYQAFDAFLFPSRFEGMPGTVVEAQVAGLPCLVSDAVTSQVKASGLVEFLPLAKSVQEWADEILNHVENCKANGMERMDLSDTNYDVNCQVRKYEEFYLTGNVSVMRN